MASNTEFINNYEMEGIFENYLTNENDLYNFSDVSHAIGDKRKKKLAAMTDEERTARRKKFQKILKIGALVGAATTLVVFGPQIMAALAPVFPAMKSALAKKGINPKGLKIGEIAEKFSTEVAGKPIPEGKDKAQKGMAVAKNVLGYFASAKKRRDAGTSTKLENALLDEADKVTDKISKLSESDAAKTLSNILTEGTADEGTEVSGKGTTKEGTESTGMDFKKYLPIALGVLVLLFVMKK
jgi:hypothetical protein